MNGTMRHGRENKHAFFIGQYNQNFNYVYSYVFARAAGSRQLTEDIVQDVFTAAWLSFDSFRQRSSMRTWLCSIAKNKLRESYRRATRRDMFELPDSPNLDEQASGIDLEGIVLSNETQQVVLDVLEGMTPLYRYTLIMKYMDDMRVKEIAGVLGRSPKAVDGILQRAKCDFQKAYMKREGSDWNEE